MIFKHKEAAAAGLGCSSFRLQAQQCLELWFYQFFFETRSLMMSFVRRWLWSHWSYESPLQTMPRSCRTHFTILEHIWIVWTGAVSSGLIGDVCVMRILFRFPSKCSCFAEHDFRGTSVRFNSELVKLHIRINFDQVAGGEIALITLSYREWALVRTS